MMDESKEREAFEKFAVGLGARPSLLNHDRWHWAWRAWLGRAALAQPEGWQLVPKEATTAMRVALWDTLSTTGGAHVAWRKALAAAPRTALAQPEPEPEQWKVVDEWAGGCRLRRVQPEPEPDKGMKLECRLVERGADYMTVSVTAKDAESEPEPDTDADVLETSPPLVVRVRRHPEPEPELPAPHTSVWDGVRYVEVPVYTADQVRAAILADRKRRERP